MKKVMVSILALLFVFVCSVYAEITYKTIKVELRNIVIYVNNKKVNSEVEPFIFGGRTFVPIRMVAEALEKDVSWDPVKNRIDITNKDIGSKNPGTGSKMVYITATGDKYHLEGCRYLDESKTAITLEEAKAKGYKPSGVCKPPG